MLLILKTVYQDVVCVYQIFDDDYHSKRGYLYDYMTLCIILSISQLNGFIVFLALLLFKSVHGSDVFFSHGGLGGEDINALNKHKDSGDLFVKI